MPRKRTMKFVKFNVNLRNNDIKKEAACSSFAACRHFDGSVLVSRSKKRPRLLCRLSIVEHFQTTLDALIIQDCGCWSIYMVLDQCHSVGTRATANLRVRLVENLSVDAACTSMEQKYSPSFTFPL